MVVQKDDYYYFEYTYYKPKALLGNLKEIEKYVYYNVYVIGTYIYIYLKNHIINNNECV